MRMSIIFWLFAKSFSMDAPVLDPSSVGPKTIARFGELILFSGNGMNKNAFSKNKEREASIPACSATINWKKDMTYCNKNRLCMGSWWRVSLSIPNVSTPESTCFKKINCYLRICREREEGRCWCTYREQRPIGGIGLWSSEVRAEPWKSVPSNRQPHRGPRFPGTQLLGLIEIEVRIKTCWRGMIIITLIDFFLVGFYFF